MRGKCWTHSYWFSPLPTACSHPWLVSWEICKPIGYTLISYMITSFLMDPEVKHTWKTLSEKSYKLFIMNHHLYQFFLPSILMEEAVCRLNNHVSVFCRDASKGREISLLCYLQCHRILHQMDFRPCLISFALIFPSSAFKLSSLPLHYPQQSINLGGWFGCGRGNLPQ